LVSFKPTVERQSLASVRLYLVRRKLNSWPHLFAGASAISSLVFRREPPKRDMVNACHLRAKALYSAIETKGLGQWSLGESRCLTRLDRLQEGQSEARLRLIKPPVGVSKTEVFDTADRIFRSLELARKRAAKSLECQYLLFRTVLPKTGSSEIPSIKLLSLKPGRVCQ
jgi:hypothetical protein